MAIVPFPCTPIPEEIENHNQNNNYYYIRVRAREQIPPEMAEICEMYQDVFDRPMARYYQKQALEYLASGIQADMICAVIAYTGGAPRPSWAYASAVIERQAAQGARTAADFRGNVSSWRSTRSAAPAAAAPQPAPKCVIEQCYNQRVYTQEDEDRWEQEALAEMMADYEKMQAAGKL